MNIAKRIKGLIVSPDAEWAIIEAEDKQDPMSDQAFVEILAKQDGIQIARRTVAKYREMLGILASSKRKKLF